MAGAARQSSNRRASITATCPSNGSHTPQRPPAQGEGGPIAVRGSRPQPMIESGDSGNHDSSVSDSASTATASTAASAPAIRGIDVPSPSLVPLRPKFEVESIILQNMEPDGADMASHYMVASLLPPVTNESLAELDMARILNNPKLRHDINFDRELHFRPNLDGSKGKRKLRAANEYWMALQAELFLYRFAAVHKAQALDRAEARDWRDVQRASPRRLKAIFETVRDILKTLVPDEELAAIDARLDADLIMQEIINGVCDLFALSTWLAKVLKEHCAPMRDEQVDEMKMAIDCGASEDRDDKLVEGLRLLLTILESMKLDVANHQIRHMRPLLIGDTVNFEQKYHAHRVEMGKIDVPKTLEWFQRSRLPKFSPELEGDIQGSPLLKLTTALVNDLVFDDDFTAPPTFYLDSERLQSIRTEIQHLIHHKLCGKILAECTASTVPPLKLWEAQNTLQSKIATIVGPSGSFTQRIEYIAVEILRMRLWLEGHHQAFDASSLPKIEQKLRKVLEPTSESFGEVAQSTYKILILKLLPSVDEHSRVAAVSLETLIPCVPMQPPAPPPHGMGAVCTPSLPANHDNAEDNVVKRLTHVLCLHWHVWAELVYVKPSSQETSTSHIDQSDVSTPGVTTTSPSTSPKMPFAEAVFAPGKKWLPVGVRTKEVSRPSSPASDSPRSDSETSVQEDVDDDD